MPTEKTQRQKFEEAAREYEANESIEAFEKIAAKVAEAPKLTMEQIKEFARRDKKAPER